MNRLAIALAVMLFGSASADGAPGEYCAIHVVDADTGRGVPLVRLESTSKVEYYTDSNGYVAYLEPGLMNKDVWFTIASPGYEFPNESFGYRGQLIKTTPGKEVELKIKRTNIAERLYRETGQGIYRDTILLGKKPPIDQGALNQMVTGQDTAYATPYKGKLFWLWGDTNRLTHPLGNFFVTAATVKLPAKGGLDPNVGVNFDYFASKDGFTKEMCRISKETLPIWLDSLLVARKDDGGEQLMARFVRAGPNLQIVDQGIVLYRDDKELFEQHKQYPISERRIGLNHQFRAVVNDIEYFYGCSPYPWLRVPTTVDAVSDPEQYEAFTCVTNNDTLEVDRDQSGKPVWKWRKNTQPLSRELLQRLVDSKAVSRDDCPFDLHDAKAGTPIKLHYSTVYWNDYRKCWVMIGGQTEGASNLGEIWYAEANAPEGPWKAAVKVATHAIKQWNMDLYNPLQHPYFARENGKIIFFEGTYTNSFSGADHEIPYYEYNQLMYRLDLSDPRLKLPAPPPGLSDAKPSPNGAS